MVTNNHVVEGADTLSVCFIDNKVYEANVKGTDAEMTLQLSQFRLTAFPMIQCLRLLLLPSVILTL
mgnify:CR=1 FL=1